MKFYVASKFHNYRQVRTVIDCLEQLGHEITYDWTDSKEFDNSGDLRINPETDLSDEQKLMFATADMRGAMEADILILLEHPNMCGAYMEAGMALAAGKIVFIVGHRWTIFYGLPQVMQFQNTRTLFEYIEGMSRYA